MKCQFFLWLVVHNRCWTTGRLAKRELPHPERCPLCDQADESIQHILNTCVFARQVWFLLFIRFGLPDGSPQPDNVFFSDWWVRTCNMIIKPMKHGFNTLVILGAWLIWKHHNDCVFNGVTPSVHKVLCQDGDEARLWCDVGAKGLLQLIVS